MATRYFNWKLATVLVVAVTVFAAAALALHSWQRSTRAEQALPLGEQAYNQGNWEEAAKQLGRYLAIHGDDVQVLLQYADAQLKIRPVVSDAIQHAIAAYSSVLRLDSGNTQAARHLVEIYSSMGTPGEAQLKAEQYLKDTDDPIVRRFLGVALVQQREFRKAGDIFAKLVLDHPDQILAYDAMGRLAEARPGDVNEPAAYWFDEAIRQNPDSALGYATRAAFRTRRGDHADAMADLERAETLDLSDKEIHLRLIAELIKAQAFDTARKHLRDLQTVAPTEQMLWQGWAEVAARSGTVEEMLTVAEAGLKELATQPWDFMPVAAELLIRADRVEQAQDCVVRMKEKNVQPARVAFLEGLLAERQGQLRDAVTCWQKAIGLGYQSPQDGRWRGKLPLARVVLASAFLKMGDTQSAMGQLRTLVSEMPRYAGGYLLLARLEAQTGNWAGVLEHTRQVQQFSPGNGEAQVLNAQARIRQLASAEGTDPDRKEAWQAIDAQLATLMPSEADAETAMRIGLLRAESALFQDAYDRAAAVLDELQRGHPGDVRTAMLYAQLYVRQGKEQEAVSVMQRAVEQHPESVEAVTKLALLYNGQEKRSECESVVRDALATVEQPQDGRRLRLFLAELYSAWEESDRLHEWLTDMAKEFPTDIQTRRHLLTVERVVKDSERAQTIVDEIRSLEGEKGWQWRIEQARVWIRSESFRTYYVEAVRLLQENLLANPEDRASRMLLGAVYEKAGEMQLAVTTYKEALSRARPPEDLQVMLVLAAAYEKNEDLQAALATYREALQRSPDDIRIIGRTVGVLYKAQEFSEAQKILNEAAQRDLHHEDLQKLRLQGDLQRGALGSASDILQEMVDQDPNDTSARFTLALIRARQKRFAEAQAILGELKAASPDSIRIVEAQIELHVEQGNADEAMRLCDELVQRLDNVAAHTLRARTLAVLGHQEQALVDLDRAVSLQPEEPAVWLTRANFYRDLGRKADEIGDLKKALSLAPDSLMIQQRALPLFLASGDAALAQRAEATLEQSLAAHPENIGLKVLRAQVLLSKGTAPSSRQARSLLAEITKGSPRRAEAWELLGRLDLREGQPGDAVDAALRGLAHSPEDRRLCLLKADAEARRSPMLAVPTLRELLRQDPNDVDVIARLAGAHLQSGRPEEALELLQERLTALRGTARQRTNLTLATTLYRSGDTDRAVALFQTLMQSDPNDPTPLVTLARLPGIMQRYPQFEQSVADWTAGHPDDIKTPAMVAAALVSQHDGQSVQTAETVLQSVLERDPESVTALLILADLTVLTGRAEESAAANRRILEVDPNNIIALNNLAWFLCEEQGKYEEALHLADRGLEIAPEYLDLIDTRGVVHYRMGHLEDAVRDFSKFIELSPTHARSLPTTRFHLARAHAEMGRKTEAIEQLEQTLSAQSQIGGLSPSDLADAKLLLEQLKKGS